VGAITSERWAASDWNRWAAYVGIRTLAVLRELLTPIPDDLRGLRDRALLLVGFAGALRRSELTGIPLGDLLRTDQGFELTLNRSKGTQTDAVLVPLP